MKIITCGKAMEMNLKRYFTGKPCKRGHVSERLVSGRKCVECHWEAQRVRTSVGQNKEYKRCYMSDPTNRKHVQKTERIRKNNSEDYKNKKKEYQKSEKYKEYRRKISSYEINLAKRRKMNRFKYRNDELYRMNVILRTSLRRVLRMTKQGKTGRSSRILGYDAFELKERLESQFKDGMNWRNHGEWHVDHIVPVTMYIELGVTDPSVINALDNLQPLWAEENLKKGNRHVG